MRNFMNYLDMTPSMVNKCFNTVTREGQDQIFFEDVVEVIGFLEEAKLQRNEENSEEDFSLGVGLTQRELIFLLDHFDKIKHIKSFKSLQEKIEEIKESEFINAKLEEENQDTKNLLPQNTLQDFFYLLKKSPIELLNSLRIKLVKKKRGIEKKNSIKLHSPEYNNGICL